MILLKALAFGAVAFWLFRFLSPMPAFLAWIVGLIVTMAYLVNGPHTRQV